MYLSEMSSKQLQAWIAKLSAVINDGDNAALYQKWLNEAQNEQFKRIHGSEIMGTPWQKKK